MKERQHEPGCLALDEGDQRVVTPAYCDCASSQIYVGCADNSCMALLDPKTPGQYRDAYLHWKGHSVLGGCSHGF